MNVKKQLKEHVKRRREAAMTERDAAFYRRLQAMQQAEGAVRWRQRRPFTVVLSALACVFVAAAVLPVVLWQGGIGRSGQEDGASVLPLDSTTLIQERVSAQTFSEDYSFDCFPEGSFAHSVAYCYRHAEGGRRAYFLQTGIDEDVTVLLYVPMSLERYAWYDDFIGLDQSMTVGGISVSYRLSARKEGDCLYAFWKERGTDYYLEMLCSDGMPEAQLGEYLMVLHAESGA